MRHRIKQSARCGVDYTGGGIGFGDYLVKEFKEWNPEKHLYGKIKLVTFTNQEKNRLLSELRRLFDRKLIRIPINRIIREDLHSMARQITKAGTITYRANYSIDGHADRCCALALAVDAASHKSVVLSMERGPAIETVPPGIGWPDNQWHM